MKLVHIGKVKDVYEVEQDRYLFYFSDRISAFDIQMNVLIPRKGEVLCRFGEFWFNTLYTENHMIAIQGPNKMIVKRLNMIPLECIVRGYFYGSIVDRFAKNAENFAYLGNFKPVIAGKLPSPIFDPTTKSQEHDIPINEREIVSTGILSQKILDYVKETSIRLYKNMSVVAEKAGFIIADVKFEFGRDRVNGNILLADSLGPDEFRLWRKAEYNPGKIQDSYDKQILRDWIIKTGFKDVIDRLAKNGLKPTPPAIPAEIVNQLSERYVYAYEQISGNKLNK
jgi:phosphoribosylaminoimidazole-succinocarboxamide synthase